MKTKLAFLFLLVMAATATAQVFTGAQLNLALKECKNDSVKEIERLAALKFHRLINEYRKKNNIDTLTWNDTLWLAARNHCAWMSQNNKISHGQIENTLLFTGKNPGERYDFVTMRKTALSWSGENALYNYSGTGTTIEKISETMAEAAFNQWKNSPGHDQNMRAPHSKYHGTAFLAEPRGRVWATDLFARDRYDWIAKRNENQNPSMALAKKFEQTEKPSVQSGKRNVPEKEKTKKLSVFQIQKLQEGILMELEKICGTQTSKSMKKAASKHAEYMAFNKKVTHKQNKKHPAYFGSTVEKRMLKASYGLYIFKARKMPVRESITLLEVPNQNPDAKNLAGKLNSSFHSSCKQNGTVVKSGVGLCIKQTKSQLKIYAVKVEGLRIASIEEALLVNENKTVQP